ncbi:MarR family winged helix-turn-helix transcriptional regulator [Rhodospirillum sp. A1_3_36]|uniref:MarR family winged helix-turn-helix transcriptional regulator n=1 Tax=Rhodospirillum sp. A1_3_36 TaxID=3391666 RepID=UPI0039A57DA5
MARKMIEEESEGGEGGFSLAEDGAELGTSSLRGYLGYMLRRAQLLIFQDVIAALEPFDLRPTQFSMLMILSTRPGLRQAELADLLGVQRTNLVKMVDALESRGLMVRERSLEDRRSHSLCLTSKGGSFLAEARAAVEAHEAKLADALGTSNRDELLRLLTLLNRNFIPRDRGE